MGKAIDAKKPSVSGKKTAKIFPLLAGLLGNDVNSDSELEQEKWQCCASLFFCCSSGTAVQGGGQALPLSDDDLVVPSRNHAEEKLSRLLVGAIEVSCPHSEYLLPPELVLYEPKDKDREMSGKRLIFQNTRLKPEEQENLRKLHQAFEKEGDGEFPSYVRVHALRILQQAKWKVEMAREIINIHLNMRVNNLPLSDKQLSEDLRKGFMYWHGRDRSGRPCLVWKMDRMTGFTKDRAVQTMLFTLEYAVRYALMPGRIENWNLIVDLENVGLKHTGSVQREISKACSTLLESVFCGRNFKTHILHLPRLIRSVVNSMIPEDKKEKVQFVAIDDLKSVMGKLYEPNQLEQKYGGTAPNLTPQEVYPYRFFPNPLGTKSPTEEKSLHMYTNASFHEGALWDESTETAKAEWMGRLGGQSLTSAAVKDLESMGVKGTKPCQDIKTWFNIVNPEAAKTRR